MSKRSIKKPTKYFLHPRFSVVVVLVLGSLASLLILKAPQPIDVQTRSLVRIHRIAGKTVENVSPLNCTGWNNTANGLTIDLLSSSSINDFSIQNSATLQNGADNEGSGKLEKSSNVFECSNFLPEKNIDLQENMLVVRLNLSFGADSFADNEDVVVFSYSDDAGQSWNIIDSFALLQGHSNATHGGYWTYPLGSIDNLQKLEDLKIRVEYVAEPNKQITTAYLDGASIDIDYEPIKSKTNRLTNKVSMEQQDVLAKQEPVMHIETKEASTWSIVGIGSVERTVDKLKLISPDGTESEPQTNLKDSKTGKITTAHYRLLHDNFSRPGNYQIVVTMTEDDEVFEVTKSFTWGTVAINMLKEVYHTGDNVHFGLEVLNNQGETSCDAEIEITITDPKGTKSVIRSRDGSVTNSSDCGRVEITQVPDYAADFSLTSEPGEYQVEVTAQTKQERYAIRDLFSVQDQVDYDITRVGPYRVWPFEKYDMFLEVVPSQDYFGSVEERVPAGFEITNISQDGTLVSLNEQTKVIRWLVNWKSGESYSLSYTFNASNSFPASHLLGPVTIEDREYSYWTITADDDPELVPFVELPREQSGVVMKSKVRTYQPKESPEIEITPDENRRGEVEIAGIKVLNPKDDVVAEQVASSTDQDGSFELTIDQADYGRPGKYQVQVKAVIDGEKVLLTEDFLWGVVAVNVRQSVVAPGTEQQVHLAVLDDDGRTVCDASIQATVTDPGGGVRNFSTGAGTVITKPDCVDRSVTNAPDYWFFYTGSLEGEYQIEIAATIQDGERSITDSIYYSGSIPITVERTEFPTRIYPAADYPVSFTVTPERDFIGTVSEILPAEFVLYDVNNEGQVSQIDQDIQKIDWQVGWSAGQTYTLGYSFDAPDIAPYLYFMGPLTFMADGSEAFAEYRQWQIASDATKIWDGGGLADSWSDCTNWNNNTCPANTGDDILFNGTGNDSSTWDASSSVTSVASLTISSYSGTFTFLKASTTIAGNFSHTSTGNVILSTSISVSGDFTLTTSGTFTPNTNIVTLTGTSNNLNTNKTFYRLVINPSSAGTIYIVTNSPTISEILRVAASDTLSIGSGLDVTLTLVTDPFILGGTISGDGRIIYQSTAAFTTGGTISADVRFARNTGDQYISARTYGGDVECYNNTTSNHFCYAGTAASQTINIDGDFLVNSSSSGHTYIYGHTYNPTVNILGNYDNVGAGAGTEYPVVGTGSTWTISGDMDLRNGNFLMYAGSEIIMNGTSNTLYPNGRTFVNLTINPASTGTITMSDHSATVSGVLKVETGDTFSINTGLGVTLSATSGTVLTLNGTISGDGTIVYRSSTAFPSTGTMSANLQMHTSAADLILSERTYGGDVEIYNSTATDHIVTFGTAGSQTLTIGGDFNVNGGSTGDITAEGNTYDPDLVVGGSVDCTGAGGGDEILSVGSEAWIVSGSFDATNGTITNTGSHELKMDGTGTLTTDGNSLNWVTISGTITFANETISIVSGLDMSTGTVTAGTSNVALTGAVTQIRGGDNILYDFTVDGDTINVNHNSSSFTVSNNLDIDTGDTINIASDLFIIHSGSTLTLDGSITGDGTLEYQSSTAFPTTGTISSNLRLNATNNDQTMSARTYGDSVEIYNNSDASTRTVTLGAGTINVSDDLSLNATGTQSVTLSGTSNNPTVNITDNLSNTASLGAEIIDSGTGTWTISGNVDFADGTYTATSGNTFVMNGSSKTLDCNAQTFNNFTADGTITAQNDSCGASANLIVDTSDQLTLGAGVNFTWAGSTFILGGAIDGDGRLVTTSATTIPDTGTLSSVMRFDVSTGNNITMPLRTYGSDVEAFSDDSTGATNFITVAGGGTQDINGSLYIIVDDVRAVNFRASTNDPDFDIEGNIDFTGIGSGPEYLQTGSGTWNVGGSVDLTDGNVTVELNNTINMDGSGTLTTDSETLQNLTLSGSVTLANATHTVALNLDMTSGTVTAGSSTVSMTGLSSYITGGGQTLNNLTIDPASAGTISLQTSDMTIAGTLNVAADDSLIIETDRTLTHSGATLTLNGTIDNTAGSGTLVYQSSTAFPTTGTMSADLRMDSTSNDQALGARTYVEDVEIYNNSGVSARTVTLGTAGSQAITVSGELSMNAANSEAVTVQGATYDPILNVTGAFSCDAGAGAENITAPDAAVNWTFSNSLNLTNCTYTKGAETLIMNTTGTLTSAAQTLQHVTLSGTITLANATHTIAGNLSMAGGTITDGTSTVTMTGTSNTIIGGGNTLYNLIIDPASAGTITLQTSDLTVATGLTVQTDDTLTIDASRTLTWTGSSLTLNGSITGDGRLTIASATTIPTTGTLSSVVRFDATGQNETMATRTYGDDVEIYSSSGTARIVFVTGDLTFSGSLYIIADGTESAKLEESPATHNHTISGDVDFTGSGDGIEWIAMGGGTWTVGGNIDFTDGIIESISKMKMTGASKTITTGGNSLSGFEVSGGSVTSIDAMDNNGTFDVSSGGSFTQGADVDINNNGNFTLAADTTFTAASGSGKIIFDGDLTFTDSTSPLQDIGEVEIGTSPDTTDLASDFMTSKSLTVNSGDIFNTNGYDINTGNITINGTFDATDDVETDETYIECLGNFIINSTATFVQDESTLEMKATSGTKTLITDGAFSLYNLKINGDSSIIVQVQDALDLDNDLTITSGNLDVVSGENNAIVLGGSWDNDDTFTARSGTITFNAGSGTKTIDADGTGTDTFYDIVFDDGGGGAQWDLTTDMDVDNDFTITGGTFDFNGTNTLYLSHDFTNNDIMTHGGGTVVLDGSAKQTLSGTMTGGSSFNDLTITNGSSSYSGCESSFTPSVDFAAAATIADDYTITTADVGVEYNSGSTYTVQDINWDGGGYGDEIIFRNSALGSGTWLLDVSGTQTSVKYVNVGRSDASGGDLISATHVSNVNCNNTTNWDFDSITFSISDTTVGFGALTSADARYADGDATGSDIKTSAHTMTVRTAADSGYNVTYYGSTLTSGGDTIDVGDINGVEGGASGSEEFALGMTTDGNATIATGYNAGTDYYTFVAGATTSFASEAGSTAAEIFSMYYIANIRSDTEAGSYSTDITYIMTGQF
ncbi:MAG: hypothetical protein V1853_03025 [bacterium]